MMQGILIAIEGIDGAGKTTQARLLAEWFRRRGDDVVLSKEPTTGPWGRKIRESAKHGRMSLEEEIKVFTLDRKEHVETLIAPSLAAGRIVILDRYYYSFIAYQGARGADPNELARASEFAPVPDVAFLLDIDPSTSLDRIASLRGDTPNHFETLTGLRKVRDLFLEIFESLEHGVVVDGDRPVDEVQRSMLDHLRRGTLAAKRPSGLSGSSVA